MASKHGIISFANSSLNVKVKVGAHFLPHHLVVYQKKCRRMFPCPLVPTACYCKQMS